MRAQRGDPMGRLDRRAERRERQIADIKVALELRPGPSVVFIVDSDALAKERLGLERRVGFGVRLSGALAVTIPMARPST